MARFIKWFFGILIALTAIVVLALIAITTLIDPNDYKDQIEKIAKEKAGYSLHINGDIAWSLYPQIGFAINDLVIDDPSVSNGSSSTPALATLSKATLDLALMPLFSQQIQLNGLLIDGLTLKLKKDKAGKGNWEAPKISATTSPKVLTTPAASTSTQTTQATPAKSTAIAFTANYVTIKGGQVQFTDEQTKQTLALSDLNFDAKNIEPEKAFPLALSFNFSQQKPALNVGAQLNTQLTLANQFDEISLNDFQLSADVKGDATKNQTLPVKLMMDTKVKLSTQQLDITKLSLALADLAVSGNVAIKDWGTTKSLNGSIKLSPFNVKTLLPKLGIAAPVTANTASLSQVGVSTKIAGTASDLVLNDLAIQLDQTNINGQVNLSERITFNLAGTSINVDDYLPPKPEKAETTKSSANTTTANQSTSQKAKTSAKSAPTSTAPLLPIETLRSLNLGGELTMKGITINKMPMENMIIKVGAKSGLVQLKQLSGNLFAGNFLVDATINAKGKQPVIQANKKLQGINISPLTIALTGKEVTSGDLSLNASFSTTGNSIDAIRGNAKGNALLNITKAKLDLSSLLSGIQQSVPAFSQQLESQKDKLRPEDEATLKANVAIDGNKLLITKVTGGRQYEQIQSSKGTFDLITLKMNVPVELTITCEANDKNCPANKNLRNTPWPLICKGQLGVTPNKQLCRPDTSKIGQIVKTKAKEKISQKLSEKLSEKFGGKDDADLSEKDRAKKQLINKGVRALEGLFGR